LKEDNTQGTLITGNAHIDFILLAIFGFAYDIISFVVFCLGFLFAMKLFPNAVVGPWGVLVMYLKSYQGFNKKKKLGNFDYLLSEVQETTSQQPS